MKFRTIAGVSLLCLASAAQAQTMNAEQFHARATALRNKGAMAVFSSDLKPLMREGKAAGERSRDLQAAAARTGGKKRYCPPPGKFRMSSEEFMQRLSEIPAPERSQIDMTEAVTRMFAAKFPC